MKEVLSNFQAARAMFKSNEEAPELRSSDLRILRPYLKKNWKKFLVGSLLILVVSVLSMPAPLLLKYIVDTVIPAKDLFLLYGVVLVLFALYAVRILASFFVNYTYELLSQKVMLEIRRDLFAKVLRLPLAFFDKHQTGYIMSRINEVERIRTFFSSSITHLVINVLEFVFCLGILIQMNWRLTLASSAVLPFYYLVTRKYSLGMRRVSRHLMEKNAKVSQRFQETLAGVDTVKVFAAEEREAGKLAKVLHEFMQGSMVQSMVSNLSSEMLGFVGIIGTYLVLLYGSVEIMNGGLTLGGYIAFTAYLTKLYTPTQLFASFGLTIQPAAVALRRVSELYYGGDEEDGNRKPIDRLTGRIEIRNLSFAYPESQGQVLNGIALSIQPGEKVALLGPNGSGKSTIVKLLLGLYRVEPGKILLDGMDLNDLDLADLRQRIGVVSQHPFLFSASIRENIRYSRPGATDEEVAEAARLAGAFDFIEALDQGLDTMVGETGKTLSGGERQKVAIARALLKDADIIFLDEATSNLDQASVARIGNLIHRHFQEKTVILITHRIADFEGLDRILKLEKGTLVAEPAHAPLQCGNRMESRSWSYNETIA